MTVDNQIKVEHDDLVVLQLNIRGLFRKTEELKRLIYNSFKNKMPDVILLCETWMSANSPDVKLTGYNKFECRRTHKQGGGVCIFVNDMLTSKPRPDLHVSDTNFEQCMAEIILKKHKLLVGSLYRAPNTDQSKFLSDYKNLRVENIDITDSKKIANEFGRYFSTVGDHYANKIKDPNKNIESYLKVIPRNTKSIFLNPTTGEEIRSLISKLPNKKSSGFDNIDNIILKEIKDCISPKLAEIFNLSMLEGVFPEKEKLAEVVPLYKSKEKYLTNNYRPISLLITISKLLEKVIYKRTYSFLQATNQLYDSQYGFREGHSCENAISE